jgi:hypothetical protein
MRALGVTCPGHREAHYHLMAENLSFRHFLAANPHFALMDSEFDLAASKKAMGPPKTPIECLLFDHLGLFDAAGLALARGIEEDADALTKALDIRRAMAACEEVWTLLGIEPDHDTNNMAITFLYPHFRLANIVSSFAFIADYLGDEYEVSGVARSLQVYLFSIGDSLGFKEWMFWKSRRITGRQMVIHAVEWKSRVFEGLTGLSEITGLGVNVVVPVGACFEAALLEAPTDERRIRDLDVAVPVFCYELPDVQIPRFGRGSHNKILEFFRRFRNRKMQIIVCRTSAATALRAALQVTEQNDQGFSFVVVADRASAEDFGKRITQIVHDRWQQL